MYDSQQDFREFNTDKKSFAKDDKSFTQSIVLEQKRKTLQAKALSLNLPYVDLRNYTVNPDLFGLLEYNKLVLAKAIICLKSGKKLQFVGEDTQGKEFVALKTDLEARGFEVKLGLCIFEDMQLQLDQIKLFQTKKTEFKAENKLDYEDSSKSLEKYIGDLKESIAKIEPSTVAEGLNGIIFKALQMKASDIHMQPQESSTLLRFRVDGILRNIVDIDNKIFQNILTQIKYDSHLKLNVHDIPQDGRMFITVNKQKIDIRVSLIPTEFGETVVLRLLDTNKQFLNVADLGFSKSHLAIFDKISDLSQGLILVTGPTGSGKTTTLYSLLSRYNTESRKIITLEDPIEYHLQNIVQSQIKEEEGYTFQSALESVLRQDPDVVMVGEIRDSQTANTALQASLTGHVVLSTLHTNNAIESIQRLYNMGIEPFLIGPALNCIVAQRLVRKVCTSCCEDVKIDGDIKVTLDAKLTEINEIAKKNYMLPEFIKKPVGCKACNGSGYLGRIVIAELVEMDQNLAELIIKKSTNKTLLEYLLGRGYLNMEQDGILKVLAGMTTLEEVYRVTK